MSPPRLPWPVRFALAAHEAGWVLPNHLLMAVQMLNNGYGCSSCAHPTNQQKGRMP